MSEINVTPFVDVMLVLLIVFMVAAPLLTVGVQVELPKSQASAVKSDKPPLTLSVKPDGKVFLQEEEIALDQVRPRLQAMAGAVNVEDAVFVRGDERANYGVLMRVMGQINAAGFKRISLITVLEETP
ncbi:MAG: protein TolR [Hyphomicrobiales bacterium]|nr:protein TolR [Hyphomicrobiales bacterium]